MLQHVLSLRFSSPLSCAVVWPPVVSFSLSVAWGVVAPCPPLGQALPPSPAPLILVETAPKIDEKKQPHQSKRTHSIVKAILLRRNTNRFASDTHSCLHSWLYPRPRILINLSFRFLTCHQYLILIFKPTCSHCKILLQKHKGFCNRIFTCNLKNFYMQPEFLHATWFTCNLNDYPLAPSPSVLHALDWPRVQHALDWP